MKSNERSSKRKPWSPQWELFRWKGSLINVNLMRSWKSSGLQDKTSNCRESPLQIFSSLEIYLSMIWRCVIIFFSGLRIYSLVFGAHFVIKTRYVVKSFKIYCITTVLEESFVKSILVLQIIVTTIGKCWYEM